MYGYTSILRKEKKARFLCMKVRVKEKENIMSYLDETLARDSMQSLRNHYGKPVKEHKVETYEERLEQAYRKCLETVQTYDSKGEDSELFSVINAMITEHEEVYMEVGIRAGFLLAKDIFEKEDTAQYQEMYMSLFKDILNIVEELRKAQQKAEEIYLFI